MPKLPNLPIKDGSVKQDFTDLVNFVRAERITSVVGGMLKSSASGKTIVIPERKHQTCRNSEPPFFPRLTKDYAGNFTFTLTDGCVNEIVTIEADSEADPPIVGGPTSIAHQPDTALVSGGARVKFSISPGQQISVVVVIDPDTGEISTDSDHVTVITETIREDETVAVENEIHYKLAELTDPETGDPEFVLYLAGSNIFYYRSGGLTGHVLIGLYPALNSPAWQGPSTPPDASLHWFKFVNGALVATTHTTVTYSPGTYIWDARTVPAGYGSEIRRIIIPTDTGSMWE
jgi:hypothetical protein